MYELVQVGVRSFYMDCPAKVGFYLTGEKQVVLIDSGSDKDAARKVKKILDEQGWQLKAIFNTHSHADHIGGNQYLQNLTGCKIYAPGTEQALACFPILEPVTLYGASPLSELQNKFLLAKESGVERIIPEILPPGLELLPLPGHSFDMVGFRTEDDTVFLADCLSGEETLQKYHVSFLYDVEAYLTTLDQVAEMKATCFVPSHAAQTADIAPLAKRNIRNTLEIAEKITEILAAPMCFEELLSRLFREYGLSMNITQRVLVGSSVKAYLHYLSGLGKIAYRFEDNLMVWCRV